MALTFAEYLETLDDEALAALLIRRRDVCAEPVPRDLAHLADRLCTADSLFDALAELDQDAVEVGRAAAALGPQSAPETIAALLDADDAVVEAVVDRSSRSAWPTPTARTSDSPSASTGTSTPTSAAVHRSRPSPGRWSSRTCGCSRTPTGSRRPGCASRS